MRTKSPPLNRRQALALIATAALGAVSASPAVQSETPAGNVTTDLAHIGSRVYSEEGVAMFLACENLGTIRGAPPEPPAPSALNQKVASAFKRCASEWQQAHPDAPAGDVAKILEFIADKDFSSGGQEPRL